MKRKLFAIALAAGLAHAAAPAAAQEGASTARITQLGSNGRATIDQSGNLGGVGADITQNSGDANMAVINQSRLGDPVTPSSVSASITQGGGDFNAASIDQHDSGNVSARIGQDGSGNQSAITIEGSSKTAIGNTQAGIGNVAVMHQANVLNGGFSLDQAGNNNFGSFKVGSGFETVTATQNGNSNVLYIDQTGAMPTSNVVDVTATQAGDFNTAYINQTGAVGNVETHQTGNGNALSVSQDGIGSELNTAAITQASNGNLAAVTQVGGGFTATIVQNVGDGNSAVINQHF